MPTFKWLVIVLLLLAVPAAPSFCQLAPTGDHYAGRPSDTGFTGALDKATGTYATSIPLELPVARGGLPVPLQIVYISHGVGAAGLGWDITLSYIQHARTFAHRRPFSGANVLPVPLERTYLSLLGQTLELQQQGSSNEWRALSGTHALTVRQSNGSWQVDDGTGRLYTFTRPAIFGATGMWFLHSVSVAGGARVELDYETVPQSIDGGSGIQINLTRIRYNPHPTTANCWKNEVILAYEFGSPRPLSLSVLLDKIMVRRKLLTSVDVESRPTCTMPTERLRRYQFEYPDLGTDPDTGLPRLRTVREFGRQGTSEENSSLPIAAYDYGTATQDGALRYQATQSIALPVNINSDEISSTVWDESINVPATGKPYAMWQALIDVNGDGRPDLVFKRNNKLWVAYNQPSSQGASTIGAGQGTTQLSDATLSDGPVAAHTSTHLRFNYAPAKANIAYVWRQAIDVNGDGRVDIIDASEQPDHWVVYLNTPGSQGEVKWQRRSYSVTALRKTLKDFGHLVPNDYVPLSERTTGTNLKIWECWRYIGNHKWDWYSDGFANHICEGVDGGIDGSSVERGSERTFVQWEIKDINGDGYPDIVFNSSPVTYQLNPPSGCTNTPSPWVGEHCSPGRVLVQFAPGPNNAIRAMFNILGVRFYTDDNPFARSFDLVAPGADQGVDQWACANANPNSDEPCPNEDLQSQSSSLMDANGDGLADRVVGTRAYLGTYAGTAASFSNVYITLPGSLSTQSGNVKTTCVPGNVHEPTAEQIRGLRDLTGDGIPDYIDFGENHIPRVWVGTGAGFLHNVGVVTTGANFRFSHENERCDGLASITDGGLFDIDGDGRPEVVGLIPGNKWLISQLTTGGAPGAPNAGRLTQIDNGYGALTHINYVSAKSFTDNPVPFQEIVVSSVAVTGTQNLGGTLVGTRYAYSNAGLAFDSWQDRFIFPGYRRSVELRLSPPPRNLINGDELKLIGVATILDAWPLTEFQPGISKHDRWLRMERMGRLQDVMTLRGSGTVDPWQLLSVDSNDTRVIGVTHTDWDAKLFEGPPNLAPGLANCIEMVNPLDFQVSLANAGATAVDICRVHGFAFPTITESWFGGSPPPSTNNVQTRSTVLNVDNFGRITSIRNDNDVFRSDDDFCVETTYANPGAIFPRVLTAVARQQVVDCDKRAVFASELFAYDHMAAGTVSDGRVTSQTEERRETTNGTLIKAVRVFAADYDSSGNMSTVRTDRDGSFRMVSLNYDPFELVPVMSKLQATNVPPIIQTASFDPVSLAPLATTDAYQVQRGSEFDGFGRWVRSTLALPGGASGIVAAVTYDGFGALDPQGRRVTRTSYSDPVPVGSLSNAQGRRATTYLDELGRERRTEMELGHDYNDETLAVDSRVYDSAGRVVFAADPYPSTQTGTAHYGTTHYYKVTGEPDCSIRGTGPQAFTQVTDPLYERYVTCFDRQFENHVVTSDVRDASSLQANSPQEGIIHRVVSSAVGRVLEQSTLKAGSRIEFATYTQDRLGQQLSITRYLTPTPGADPVQWSWRLDSLGQMLRLTEPESPVRFFEYSDWGELTDSFWMDNGTERRLTNRFDALGRLASISELNNGIADPSTVSKFSYDSPVILSPTVTPTFVLGRLSSATSPSMQVALSYDGLGHADARVFKGDDAVVYINKFVYHADGGLAELGFNLPDNNYNSELIKYEYDSAGRLRSIKSPSATGADTLYEADTIDALGRVRKASYGSNSTLAADYSDEGRRFVKEIEVLSPVGSRRVKFANFDSMGRETAREEFRNNVPNGSPTYFKYDALGRLLSVQSLGSSPVSWQFSYNALGNITKLMDGVGNKDAVLTYRLNDRDRICRIEYAESLSGLACNVNHDASGSVTSMPTRSGSRHLSYFSSGAVRTIAEGGSNARFAYDALGTLAKLDVHTGLEQRLDRRYGGLIQQREITSGNSVKSQVLRQIPGPDGIVATRRVPGDEWIYTFGELRGNRFFTNNTGVFVQDVDYQPFGEAKSSGAQSGAADYTSAQWNGGDTLSAFGLSNLGVRIYDPVAGRFLNRDPLLIKHGATTSNPYAFAMNDPVNGADPSGFDCDVYSQCPGGVIGGLGQLLVSTLSEVASSFGLGRQGSGDPYQDQIEAEAQRSVDAEMNRFQVSTPLEPMSYTANGIVAYVHDATIGDKYKYEDCVRDPKCDLGGQVAQSAIAAHLESEHAEAMHDLGRELQIHEDFSEEIAPTITKNSRTPRPLAPGGYRWVNKSNNLVRSGNAFGYINETTPSETASDIQRLAQMGYTEIHVGTGVHNEPAEGGFSVIEHGPFFRLDVNAADVTMRRYPGVTILLYDLANPTSWSRFVGEQGAAASSPSPGVCTLGSTCFSSILFTVNPH